jgi:hypothetical protein
MPDGVRQDAGPGEYERQFFDAPTRRAHHADMTLAEVLRAVPPASRRAPDQRRALDAALCYLALAADGMQERRRRKLEMWIRIHIWSASWGGEGRAPRGVSSPGRELVCDLIRDEKTGKPLSATGYKRLRRFWEAAGFIAIVREGWTPDLSPGVLRSAGRDHNMTQAYVLCIPTRAEKKARRRRGGSPSNKTGPLSVFSQTDGSPARAREENPENPPAASCCYPAAAGRPGKPEKHERPKGSPEGGVRLHVGALARVSDRWWAHLTRPFARWDARELLYAIDHYPDGRAHLGTAERVRNPAGWLRWRLSHWLRPDGTALPSAGQRNAESAGKTRDEQARRRAEDAARENAALRSGDADRVTAAAGRARAMLAAASESAAKVIAAPPPRRPAPEPAPAPARTAGSVMAAILARRAAQRPAQPPERPAESQPARPAAPLPGYLQDAIDQAAAVAAAERRDQAGPAQEPQDRITSTSKFARTHLPRGRQ